MAKILSILSLACGGALGTLARYYLGQKIASSFSFHPAISPITQVNMIGCFIAGTVFPCLSFMPPPLKHLILIGFLGGFTTFSSFMLEALEISINTKIWLSLMQIIISNALCFVSCFLGFKLANILLKSIIY